MTKRKRYDSKIYKIGSKWNTKFKECFEIIKKEDKSGYYTGRFSDGSIMTCCITNIKNGLIKHPNYKSICNIGYVGEGICNSVNSKKEYRLWNNMIKRCYDEKYHKRYPTYVGCSVDERWHNFQLFFQDICFLKNYNEWKSDTNKINIWKLDKDILIKGNKMYSKNTCMFVTNKENNARGNKKSTLTGLTYKAVRLSDNYKELFNNQKEFCEKYNLTRGSVNLCIHNKRNYHKGWIFEVINENI
jgi:hypothetical protein